MSMLEVTECIRVDRELHLKLFYKSAPLSLSKWFHYGWNCCLTNKSMLENFPVYLNFKTEKF